MPPRFSVPLVVILGMWLNVCFAGEDFSPFQPPPVAVDNFEIIAEVNHARIRAGEVYELWNPIWYETLTRVRNGKMTGAEGDARLTEEWRKVIMALIKDEVLYQEAENEENSLLNQYVDSIMRQGQGMSRQQVMAEVRRRVETDTQRQISRYNNEVVQQSGGAVKLNQVLRGRDLTYQDWLSRIRKKAYTQVYLSNILRPRVTLVTPGPRDIQDYYANNTEEFAVPGLVSFRHIFFANDKRGAEGAREAAIEAWERLTDGEIDFAAAVREYSDDDPSARREGYESGEPASDPEREAWLSDVRTAVKEETPGNLTPILESMFGFHLAELIAIGPDSKRPFNEVRRDIEQKLRDRVWEEATDRFFMEVMKRMDVRVLKRQFPASLSCAAQTFLDPSAPTIYQIGGRAPAMQSRARRSR